MDRGAVGEGARGDLVAAVDGVNGRPRVEEASRDRGTQAARPAGDYGDLSREIGDHDAASASVARNASTLFAAITP